MSFRLPVASSVADALRIAGKLAVLQRSQWWSGERIRQWQQQRLGNILRHAVTNIPYYRDLGIDAAGLDGKDALARFPLLTKEIIQSQGARLRDPSLDPAALHTSTTSGSSGQPTATWFDHDSWLLCKYALKIRRTLLGGRAFGQRVMVFGETGTGPEPSGPDIHDRLAYRELRLSVFLPIEEQYAALTDFGPTMIYGAPSALKALCDHANEQALPLPAVRTVFLSSELVSSRLRAQLEDNLRCRVIGVYGSTEFKEVAWQCAADRYHLNFESVFVETLPSPEPEGDPRIVLTTLVNRAMPLIRFDIGDYGRLGTAACSCGRQSPWLAHIAGRRVEYLELADGRRISPYLITTHIEKVPGLRQYQIVQRGDGSLELRVVSLRGHDVGALAATLDRILADLAGPATRIRVKPVDAIRRTPAGKHRVVTREE